MDEGFERAPAPRIPRRAVGTTYGGDHDGAVPFSGVGRGDGERGFVLLAGFKVDVPSKDPGIVGGVGGCVAVVVPCRGEAVEVDGGPRCVDWGRAGVAG